MDYTLKQNIENTSSVHINKTKVCDNLKKAKGLVKPLCDVKNIIEDKINLILTNKIVQAEDDFCENLSFFQEFDQDEYFDIIPKCLQLEYDDFSKLSAVMDCPSKDWSHEKNEYFPLPELVIPMEFNAPNEQSYIIEEIDLTNLLFKDIELVDDIEFE